MQITHLKNNVDNLLIFCEITSDKLKSSAINLQPLYSNIIIRMFFFYIRI
jgi:hypothetical protein